MTIKANNRAASQRKTCCLAHLWSALDFGFFKVIKCYVLEQIELIRERDAHNLIFDSYQ